LSDARIVVEIDGRQYQGTSVVETQIIDRRGSSLLPPEAPEIVSNSRGEAVVVDLGQHGFLFGLLQHPPSVGGFNGSQPESVLARCLSPAERSDRENLLKNIQALQGECELSERDRPTLIRFRDTNDPSSAELIEPERFSEVYGPSAAFVRATISITSDPAGEATIDRTLPWLREFENASSTKRFNEILVRIDQRTTLDRLRISHFKSSG
jgi:hypothetical protein